MSPSVARSSHSDNNNNSEECLSPTPNPSSASPVAPSPYVLRVQTTTWTRDSHDLFDYEARHVNAKTFFLRKGGKLFRQGVEVSLIHDGHAFPASSDYLLAVKARADGKFQLAPAERSCAGAHGIQPKKLWLIVRDLRDGLHTLTENDIIKLGRFKLRVKQLVKEGDSSLPKIDECEVPVCETHEEYAARGETLPMQCRICLSEEGTPDDPLVCPCQCKGSIKFVHLDCLRHWINGRTNLADDSRGTFFFKQLPCELCKYHFPSAVMVNRQRVPIVAIPMVAPPFIVLENLVGTQNRGVHVISMAEKMDLKLGRGHESDVRIADVSISRYHATIRFHDGNFLLEDHNSKFGTLVAIRKPHTLEGPDDYALQVGRTVLHCNYDDSAESILLADEMEQHREDSTAPPDSDAASRDPPSVS
eukprot:Polyplicarium_translucidae@DN2073_c0_g1_i2.p1